MRYQYGAILLLLLISLFEAKNMRRLSEEEFEFDGKYKDGKAEGKGTTKYKNGDKYEGNFKNGLRDGEGKYYYQN